MSHRRGNASESAWPVCSTISAWRGEGLMESLGDLSHEERELFEERAAIAEYDGGMPRPIAEAEARRAVGHLRWQRSRLGQRE